MNLQDKLDAKKQEFEPSVPRQALAVMHRATEELRRSGIMDKVIGIGDQAPDFTLNDVHGRSVQLTQRLAAGPVVLGFYRGGW